MTWFRWHRRHADLDARVAAATAGAQQARREADKSRARQETVRRDTIRPLREAGERNSFAEIIRASLIEGNGGSA